MKKHFMFVFVAVLLLAVMGSVDAALCRGFDGYYHDCGYNYGYNSYGTGYHGHYYGDHVITLNGVKKYNPINDYYIYKGVGYDRTRVDSRILFVSDERTYENRYYVDGGNTLRIRIVDDGKHVRTDSDVWVLNSADSCPSGFSCVRGKWG